MTSEVHLQRTLPASPAVLWQALTEPDALGAWSWPQDKFGTVAEADLRVGGTFRIDAPKAGIGITGRYIEIAAAERLVMTWHWNDADDETLVTIDLSVGTDGTRLTVRQGPFPDDARRDDHVQGWSDCLDRLPAWLHAYESTGAL
jgi:uncharacterized protein YndB with AHSA1/START domain